MRVKLLFGLTGHGVTLPEGGPACLPLELFSFPAFSPNSQTQRVCASKPMGCPPSVGFAKEGELPWVGLKKNSPTPPGLSRLRPPSLGPPEEFCHRALPASEIAYLANKSCNLE